MMKKVLSLIILGFACFSLQAQQPCTPGSQTVIGIYPDTLINLPTAYVNQPYYAVITAVLPADTLGFAIDSIGVTAIDSLPAGFIYSANTPSAYWPGGGKGCIAISGTPTAAQIGLHKLVIHLLAKVSGLPMPYVVNGYKINVIDTTSAINDLVSEKFEMLQNNPNPFSYSTEIRFNSPKSGNYEFSVCNILGEVVYKTRVNAINGANTITFNGKDLRTGLYLYKLSNGVQTITKRMTIE
jgi:hypothetical protein